MISGTVLPAFLSLRSGGRFFGSHISDERGDLAGLDQTFDGEPLYPSAQSRAAHLLYFIIKDHPFVDGNKRIACLLLLEYLHRNDLLQRDDGRLAIEDSTLVALALLVAESHPKHKDMLIRLTVNLLTPAS